MSKYQLEVNNPKTACCPSEKLRLNVGENGFCLYNDRGELIIDASTILNAGEFTVVKTYNEGERQHVCQGKDEKDYFGNLLRWRYVING